MESSVMDSLPTVVIICSVSIVLLMVALIGAVVFALVKRRQRHGDTEAEANRAKESSTITWPHRQNSSFLMQVYI